MRIIKLNAINSTNTFLKELSSEEAVADYTVVQTDYQTNGRGQMGTTWTANSGENLMFSVLKDISFLSFHQHFYISIAVSLSLIKTLKQYQIPNLYIKWPNDILSDNKKVCGVLIENSIKQNKFKDSIIGIGLNVNQTDFKNLPQASSLKLVSGKVFDLEELLLSFIENLKHYFSVLEEGKPEDLKKTYETYMFRKKKPSTFKDAEGNMFTGIIQSVSETGNLQVLLEDAIIKEYGFKEISLLY
ncbi:biotin--[acetyl-CoA-carboxylase] ligase [Oceanihabitans sediminis]|uniref:Biotin--[acetyl-CoA-carboxylase] ligase n=1 Tax=Oceanihabitans sediminis TaxID=1812012 RepID=A0A368P7K7_9FLAO|nr:biotin--[acetyl-CoA-carboxylase] ligase [Oceanihabitans sediminis]MDX1278635.1 biotin--[acetyl-CoA-carboxylase] ligase [Oceanihabitans sediminis]RBP29906.1 BirA family biotin operon repressor/biotin-[acetyl-CoA-carboxylase] ligase [Oceanihabitans sediminis]RCU57241.1 biotin--[acetyl-CoA-carboxylase] ligase [Oceanihabitans sediminis]